PVASRTSMVTVSAMSVSRTLHGVAHEDDATLGAGDGALDEQQPLLDIDRVHGQVLDGLAVVAHAASHAHALEDATGRRCATDRAGLAVVAVGTVGGADAGEAVALHDACGSLALRGARHVDLRPGLEGRDRDLLAERVLLGVRGAHLGD